MLPGLNLIRLMAALGVVLYHARFRDLPGWPAGPNFDIGWHCVNVFFVVSGYLLSHSVERSSGIEYWLRRTARIMPLYLVVTAYCAWAWPWRGYNVTSVLSFEPMINEPVWTLKYEMLCYGLLWLCRIHRWPLWAFVPVLAACGIYGSLNHLGAGWPPEFWGALAKCGSMFISGVAVARFARQSGESTLGYVATWRIPAWAAVPGVAMYLIGNAYFIVFGLGAVGLAMAVFGLARHIPVRLCPMKWDLSYGLYLIHTPLLIQMEVKGGSWADVGMVLVMLVPLAALSWRYLEHPFITLSRRYRAKRTAGVVAHDSSAVVVPSS